MKLRNALILTLSSLAGAQACRAQTRAADPPAGTPPAEKGRYLRPADDVLRTTLSPLAYRVTQDDATEPPFQNAYWDHHAEGLYVDVVTGEPLFSSRDKFDSGTGWPSFTRPVDAWRVRSKTEGRLGMARTEVRSAAGDSHLGHVFADGPAPTGLRYCINSAALRFVPRGDLGASGYAEYLPHFTGEAPTSPEPATANQCTEPAPGEAPGCAPSFEVAILAGGCFWGMEDLLREIPGVIDTEVGYVGGTTTAPRYEEVHTGRTGHAEAVRVIFDPKRLGYAELLEKWFFRLHDPTTQNRQGNDVGSQYRSAIFTTTPEQERVALEAKARVQASGFWKAPLVTEVTEAGPFTAAEAYHQDYLDKHPSGYTCHYLRE